MFCRASFELALPYYENAPAGIGKQSYILGIPRLIAPNLCTPICLVRLRPDKTSAVMVMPETAMYKNNCVIFSQDDIRTAREASDILSIAQTAFE